MGAAGIKTCGKPFSSVKTSKDHTLIPSFPHNDRTPLTLSSSPPFPLQRVVTSKGRDSGRTERERGNLVCVATLVAKLFKLTERGRADRRRRSMSQKCLLLSPWDESRTSNCFTSLASLVDKTDSHPFGDSPKRTHAGFDCKVKRPAVNLERQVRRHRTADSPRLFFPPTPHHGYVYEFLHVYIHWYVYCSWIYWLNIHWWT